MPSSWQFSVVGQVASFGTAGHPSLLDIFSLLGLKITTLSCFPLPSRLQCLSLGYWFFFLSLESHITLSSTMLHKVIHSGVATQSYGWASSHRDRHEVTKSEGHREKPILGPSCSLPSLRLCMCLVPVQRLHLQLQPGTVWTQPGPSHSSVATWTRNVLTWRIPDSVHSF